MYPYMAKRISQMWLRGKIVLKYLVGPIYIRILKGEKLSQLWAGRYPQKRHHCDLMAHWLRRLLSNTRERQASRKLEQPSAVTTWKWESQSYKFKEVNSFNNLNDQGDILHLLLPERNAANSFDFNPVRPMSDLWPTELSKNTFLLL